MEETELTKDDETFLIKKLKSYQRGAVYALIFLPILYYGFYYFNFPLKTLNPINKFSVVMQLIVLVLITIVMILGIERNKNLKRNLSKQRKIVGYFKVIEKEITNKKDPNDISHYVIKVFSKIENKNKYIFLNGIDYRRISIEDSIYIEYFVDSDFIKTLKYENQKLEYLRYHIYNNTWG